MRFIAAAIAFSAASLAFTSCGGSSSQNITPTVAPAVRSATNSDLLYVGYTARMGSTSQGVLSVVTFPGGTPVATIDLAGYPTGACSDTSGNVWVVVMQNRTFSAYEFAHGGRKPIHTIHIPHPYGFAQDCAIDPTTGDLAVLTGAAGSFGGYADVWAGARPGKPAAYVIQFTPTSCTYDSSGNLFVDGWIGSTVFFDLAELMKGSGAFAPVTLKKPLVNYPGAVRWDGQYLDVADIGSRGRGIYRIDVSEYNGRVVSIVDLQDVYYLAVFQVQGDTIAGNSGYTGSSVSLWNFPAGGKRVKTIGRFSHVRGLAISLKE
jgi:hypothetical protein